MITLKPYKMEAMTFHQCEKLVQHKYKQSLERLMRNFKIKAHLLVKYFKETTFFHKHILDQTNSTPPQSFAHVITF